MDIHNYHLKQVFGNILHVWYLILFLDKTLRLYYAVRNTTDYNKTYENWNFCLSWEKHVWSLKNGNNIIWNANSVVKYYLCLKIKYLSCKSNILEENRGTWTYLKFQLIPNGVQISFMVSSMTQVIWDVWNFEAQF